MPPDPVSDTAASTESEKNFHQLFRHCYDGLLIVETGTHRFIMANPSICRMLGYSEEELTELTIEDIHPSEDLQRNLDLFIKLDIRETEVTSEVPVIRKDGTVFHARIETFPLTIKNRKCMIGIFRDISEQAELENQLHQSQKLASIGQLTAGIAHDFNNILTTILGYSGMILSDMEQDDPNRIPVAEIQDAGEQAAKLIRQLMAFSRKQRPPSVKTDLRTVLLGVEKMLRRIIGEDITFITDYSPETPYVKVASGQMEQMLMNLAVNARDAMPQGGRLILEIHPMKLGKDFCSSHPGSKPGYYARISMTDTGTGIPPENVDKIFDPFFTTKDSGEGTGLGLSIAYRIVKQSNGYIEVNSELGKGTCINVYLPAMNIEENFGFI